LIDGEHSVTPSANTRHQRISWNLSVLIGAWLTDHPIGKMFSAPYDVVFSKLDVVQPDLLYLSNERAATVLTPMHAEGSPELVIEIASPGTRTRDETVKRRLYEKYGVVEYWVIDPELDVVRVHRRSGERFDRAVELSHERGHQLTSPLLPGLTLSLELIFRD
jgi:Uma2 family endonuclease